MICCSRWRDEVADPATAELLLLLCCGDTTCNIVVATAPVFASQPQPRQQPPAACSHAVISRQSVMDQSGDVECHLLPLVLIDSYSDIQDCRAGSILTDSTPRYSQLRSDLAGNLTCNLPVAVAVL